MGDRRESIASYFLPMSLNEQESEEGFVVSPDATDGIGSIEFTKEEDSGYYGRNVSFFVSVQFHLTPRSSRAVVQHCIYAQYSTCTICTPITSLYAPTRGGIKVATPGYFAPPVTRCFSSYDTSGKKAVEALHRGHRELRRRPGLSPVSSRRRDGRSGQPILYRHGCHISFYPQGHVSRDLQPRQEHQSQAI